MSKGEKSRWVGDCERKNGLEGNGLLEIWTFHRTWEVGKHLRSDGGKVSLEYLSSYILESILKDISRVLEMSSSPRKRHIFHVDQ